jgi:hypothetical protein
MTANEDSDPLSLVQPRGSLIENINPITSVFPEKHTNPGH